MKRRRRGTGRGGIWGPGTDPCPEGAHHAAQKTRLGTGRSVPSGGGRGWRRSWFGGLHGGGGFDDKGGGEIGHEMGVGFVELEDGSKSLDGAAEGGRGDGAGEFEVGGEGESGIGVKVGGALAAGEEGGAIGFADGTADEHFGGFEDAEDGLPAVELIAFLGVPQGIVAPENRQEE